MSRKIPIHPLLRGVQAVVPDAKLTLLLCRDWYSMTYAGERVEFSIRLEGEDATARLASVVRELPRRNLALPDRIVAELVVTRIEGTTAFAEALLLDQH